MGRPHRSDLPFSADSRKALNQANAETKEDDVNMVDTEEQEKDAAEV